MFTKLDRWSQEISENGCRERAPPQNGPVVRTRRHIASQISPNDVASLRLTRCRQNRAAAVNAMGNCALDGVQGMEMPIVRATPYQTLSSFFRHEWGRPNRRSGYMAPKQFSAGKRKEIYSAIVGAHYGAQAAPCDTQDHSRLNTTSQLYVPNFPARSGVQATHAPRVGSNNNKRSIRICPRCCSYCTINTRTT